jgi:glycosyltransferase involved in cell wall biosynthesis
MVSAMAEPLVSVIVPAYNAEVYLQRTLASAQAQTWRRLEIIIVDDGSNDATPAIAGTAAREDGRVRVIRQANAGVAAARNRAIAAARGQLLAPLDADDLWHPDYLRRQVAALEASGPECALAYAWVVNIDAQDRIISFSARSTVRSRHAALRQLVVQNFIGNGSSVVLRRDAVEAAGGYDPSLRARNAEGCEDHALYAAIAEIGDFAPSYGYLVGYRRHALSMSSDKGRMARSGDLVRDALFARRSDLPGWWQTVGRSEMHKRALADGINRRDAAAIAAALRRCVADGTISVSALVGSWVHRRLAARLRAHLVKQRSWAGRNLAELWAATATLPTIDADLTAAHQATPASELR